MQDKGKAFDEEKYAEIRRGLENLTKYTFADFVTLREVAEITHSTYGAVYYALRAKLRLISYKHGVQHFVLWTDARDYADVLRARRLKRAAELNKRAANIEKSAKRRLAKAKKLSGKVDRQVEKSTSGVKRTPVPGNYETIKEQIAPGDMTVAEAAPITGYTVNTLTTYATPSYNLVKSYIVGGRRVLPASEVERLRRRKEENDRKREQRG